MPEGRSDRGQVCFTAAGQLYSSDFADIYFSVSGAEEEAEHVFIAGNNLKERFAGAERFVIAEAGFGTGLNFLKTMAEWAVRYTPGRELIYIGFEMFPLPVKLLREVYRYWPDLQEYTEYFLQVYAQGHNVMGLKLDCLLAKYNIRLLLYSGDINVAIESLSEPVDAWFLDGFAPAKNPQMWSNKVFESMRRWSNQGSTFATYSCARVVREGLKSYGFEVQKIPGFGKKKYMLAGTLR